jgi:hypothetical protein
MIRKFVSLTIPLLSPNKRIRNLLGIVLMLQGLDFQLMKSICCRQVEMIALLFCGLSRVEPKVNPKTKTRCRRRKMKLRISLKIMMVLRTLKIFGCPNLDKRRRWSRKSKMTILWLKRTQVTSLWQSNRGLVLSNNPQPATTKGPEEPHQSHYNQSMHMAIG